MRAFIISLLNRYAYVRGRQSRRVQEARARGKQLTPALQTARAISVTTNRGALVGQRPRAQEMRRLKPRCAAMNAMEWGTLRECAKTGLKAEPKVRIRQRGKNRRSVRNARGRQMANPHAIVLGGRPRIRETKTRCNGRQLLSPHRPRKCCREKADPVVAGAWHPLFDCQY
jgi:hypothetical protein